MDGYAIVLNGVWQREYSTNRNNLRTLLDGETVVECEWDSENSRPIGVTMPAEPVKPNWPKFQDDLIKSTAYRRIVGANSNTLAIAPVLSNLAFLISSQPEVIPRFVTAWNEIATLARPTSTERTALNTIATNCNVPFQLNAQGLIEI